MDPDLFRTQIQVSVELRFSPSGKTVGPGVFFIRGHIVSGSLVCDIN